MYDGNTQVYVLQKRGLHVVGGLPEVWRDDSADSSCDDFSDPPLCHFQFIHTLFPNFPSRICLQIEKNMLYYYNL